MATETQIKTTSEGAFVKLPHEIVRHLPSDSDGVYSVIIHSDGVIQFTPKQESHTEKVTRQLAVARKVMRDNAPMLKRLAE